MTSNKPDEPSSTDSKNPHAGQEEKSQEKKEWFHDSSLTESEALRAMIGKQHSPKEDAIKDSVKSKKLKKKKR